MLDKARDAGIGGCAGIGRLRCAPFKFQSPYGHFPGSVRPRDIPTVDDASHPFRRKRSAAAAGNPREVGREKLEERRDRSVTFAVLAVAAFAVTVEQLCA